ncbi:MAG: hypothetical protein PVG19_09625 [Desulfobacterales bacterium]
MRREIATHEFPSIARLQNVDVNSVKLRNDDRKFVLIEALGRFNVPVILPYGNRDARYEGQVRSVNLLSLAAIARTYSALDQNGRGVPGFHYSPLSSGDETAVYDIVECPHPDDPFEAVLDINADGRRDYAFLAVRRSFRPTSSTKCCRPNPGRERGKGEETVPPRSAG